MKPFELITFARDAELARAAASACASAMLDAPSARPFLVALSGGRIAKQFCAELSEEGRRRGTTFSGAHFFWADERCVPPADPESNFALAQQHLFAPLGVPPEQIHRIRGELPPADAARLAADELARIAHKTAADLPVLDLVLLGMGEDGHVASLFPGEPESAMSNPAIYRAVVASKPPPHRITMGYSVIAAAREVWVLASGAGKEAALRESLRPGGTTPLARVLARRNQTRIFTDIPYRPEQQ